MTMPNGPAIGLIELCSVARGLTVCDAMVKKSAVHIIRSTSIQPGKYIILISGGVDEVSEAMRAGQTTAADAFIDRLELPNPHGQLSQVLETELAPPMDSLGIIECYSVASTIRAADAALKAAEVNACRIELADGLGGKGYFVFTGELHDVEAAVEAGLPQVGDGLLAGCEIIARPHPDFIAALRRPR